jgi:nitrogen-specific signal transduction histidine kinase
VPEPVKTHYASAERASEADLLLQIRLVAEVPIIKDLFDSMPLFIAILNHQRQIVFANKPFTDFFINNGLFSPFGKRIGEAINCLHANDCSGGCGTSEACAVCGAVNAILLSQKNGSAKMECRITLQNGDPLDLSILANQYKIGNTDFTIFTAADISTQNRMKALERIFFHDILNTIGSLKGFLDLTKNVSAEEKEQYIDFSQKITGHMIEEILSQKDLISAENGDLYVNITSFSTMQVLNETVMLFEKRMVTAGKSILIAKDADDIMISSDMVLLRRVIGNLIKNALEEKGATVILDCRKIGDSVLFSVNNAAVIPKEVQLQIFQRSFSTKGEGRGLGTYSIKLLSEKYLKGKINFASNKENGTTFYLKFPLDIEKQLPVV